MVKKNPVICKLDPTWQSCCFTGRIRSRNVSWNQQIIIPQNTNVSWNQQIIIPKNTNVFKIQSGHEMSPETNKLLFPKTQMSFSRINYYFPKI